MSPSPADDEGAGRGFVNAHTHVYSGLAPLDMPAPRTAPANFVGILEQVWWRLDRALDRDSLRAATRWYVADALLRGTTTLIDHHESPGFIEGSLDVLADACDELGMRALLCYGATERNGGRAEARRGLAECRRFARDNRRAQVRAAVGLHASFTVSDATLAEAAALCRELRTVMHVHLAEDVADVADARGRGYPGPLERLLAHGALPAGSILAHGVHLDAGQVAMCAAEGCWLVQNPRSNEGNRVGYPFSLHASTRVALGTDGHPSDMPEELRALQRIARANGEPLDGLALSGRLDAGRALVAERFGVVDDRIELDAPGPNGGTRAHSVVIAGRAVVRNGRLANADIGEIRAHAREQAPRLWARMEALA